MFCLSPSGLADERPGQRVCGQRLRDLQHATGAAEITDTRGEKEHSEEEKTDGNRSDTSPGLLIPPSFSPPNPADISLCDSVEWRENSPRWSSSGSVCEQRHCGLPNWLLWGCSRIRACDQPWEQCILGTESYLPWGKTHTEEKVWWRIGHNCSELISTFSHRMRLTKRQFTLISQILPFSIGSGECYMSSHVSSPLLCTFTPSGYQNGLQSVRFSFFLSLFSLHNPGCRGQCAGSDRCGLMCQ